jgi:hypothetical protein
MLPCNTDQDAKTSSLRSYIVKIQDSTQSTASAGYDVCDVVSSRRSSVEEGQQDAKHFDFISSSLHRLTVRPLERPARPSPSMAEQLRSRLSLRRSLDKRRNSAIVRIQELSEEHTKLVAILKGLEVALEAPSAAIRSPARRAQ